MDQNNEDKYVTLTRAVSYKVPLVPNFILVYEQDKISIADIDDKDLEIIGQAFTEALVKKARMLRNSK